MKRLTIVIQCWNTFERCLVRLEMSINFNVIFNILKQTKHLNSDALPTPLNIRLRQTSTTSMEVSWDELYAKNPLDVLGYRIYYSSTPNANIDKWSFIDIGPGTSAEVHGLDPSTTYSVRIRARGSDGRFGILSDQVVSNRLDYGCNFRMQFHPRNFYLRRQNVRIIFLKLSFFRVQDGLLFHLK